MYDIGIIVFSNITEKVLKSNGINLILSFMCNPSTCERERVLRWFHIMLPRSLCVQNQDTIHCPFNSSSGPPTESVVHTLPPRFGLVSHKRMSTVTKQEYCFLPNCKWCEVRKTGCSNTPTTYLITS